MIRPGAAWAVARAELRAARRLIRFWMFVLLGASAAGAGLLFYVFLHRTFSFASATVAGANPRYLVGLLGLLYILVFLLGLIFLGFDVRARDRRERMVDALDARPVTNVELVCGRALGLLLPALAAVAVTAAALAFSGAALDEPIEPWSLVAFVAYMAGPAFLFAIGLVFIVTLLVRSRAVAALLLVAIVAALAAARFRLPYYLLALVDIAGDTTLRYPSDVLPATADPAGLMQRLGVAAAGAALLLVASAVHPRPDDRRSTRRAIAGAILLGILAMGAIATPAAVGYRDLRQVERWMAAQHERASLAPPSIQRIDADVRLDPGRDLQVTAAVTLRPAARSLPQFVFTLNPGLHVSHVADGGGNPLTFTQHDGLLEVMSSARAPENPMRIVMTMRGTPDLRFAYLDAVLDPRTMAGSEGQLRLLGSDAGIYDHRYVALMPGLHWLPSAGAAFRGSDPLYKSTPALESLRVIGSDPPIDFVDLDLTVDVPQDWTVAGPGLRRNEPAAPGRSRVRFSPRAAVPEVAVIAARFVGRAIDVNGVRFEILMSPVHAGRLSVFDDAAGEIREWIRRHLADIADLGLAYPYESLTAVEVPNALRVYAGGWRLDTTQAPPAMLLIRESGLPTARFDVGLKNPARFSDTEGGIAGAKRRILENFFENDFSGGNIFAGAARNFFAYRTCAAGASAAALDFTLDRLTTLLVTGKDAYFSPFVLGGEFGRIIPSVIGNWFGARAESGNWIDAIVRATASAEVWDAVLTTPLSALDPWRDPRRTIDLLALKGGAMAHSTLDALGRDQSGRLLATLIARRHDDCYTREDVIAAGRAVGADLQRELGDWLDETALPGFVAKDVRAYRIADGTGGFPRYQLRFVVQNEEAVAGMARVTVIAGPPASREQTTESVSLRVGGKRAIEVGFVTTLPPRVAIVNGYLSLNRERFSVAVPSFDRRQIAAAPPFTGMREVPFRTGDETTPTSDDLDAAARFIEPAAPVAARLGVTADLDAGLPVFRFGAPPSRWSRMPAGQAWGRYRHTVAIVRAGTGDRRAVLAARLPHAGDWDVSLHLPARPLLSFPVQWGTWHLTLRDAMGSRDIDFRASASRPGWNVLGRFHLAAGDVRLELSDRTDGQLVIADAVRYVPAGRAGGPQ